MHGSLSSDAAAVILGAVNAQSTDPLAAVRTASYLMVTSAQYQVER
jgi:hypothetical protein